MIQAVCSYGFMTVVTGRTALFKATASLPLTTAPALKRKVAPSEFQEPPALAGGFLRAGAAYLLIADTPRPRPGALDCYRFIPCAVGLVTTLLLTAPASNVMAENDYRGTATPGVSLEDVRSVSSSRVLIWHQAAPGSPPVARVDLWYTQDRGRTWKQWTGSDALDNPIPFDVETDGLYGFFLVMHNAAGASAPPPTVGTAAHRWIRVDRSAPIVQILELRPDKRFSENREINIRWAVQDDNLPDRPVAMHYRTEKTKVFRLVADSLAASSAYRWTVPEDVVGRVEIKIAATDRAGNTGRCVADWLKIIDTSQSGASVVRWTDSRRAFDILESHHASSARERPGGFHDVGDPSWPWTAPPEPPRREPPVGLVVRGHGEPDDRREVVGARAAQEAKRRYDLATYHRLRGEYGVALARYQEALELDPDLLEARNDLAGLLLIQGKYAEAERQLRRVLAEDSEHRAALKSLALVQATQRDYRSAHETLQTLLRLESEDAEAWLYLGDVSLFMGDRPAAREAWLRARSLEAASEDVKERARKRLSIYRASVLAAGQDDQP